MTQSPHEPERSCPSCSAACERTDYGWKCTRCDAEIYDLPDDEHGTRAEPKSDLMMALVLASQARRDADLPETDAGDVPRAVQGDPPDLHPLSAFIDARLNEDEAVARAAVGTAVFTRQTGRWDVHTDAGPLLVLAVTESGAHTQAADLSTAWEGPERAAHIARHAPARVLAECAAKREIVRAHRPHIGYNDLPLLYSRDASEEPSLGCTSCGVPGEWYHEPWPCWTLAQLASVWADHSDYQDQWKPDESNRP